MKKKLVTVLIILLLVLVLLAGGILGFLWYRNNHVFVEGTAYPMSAESLDLREEDISFGHYETLRSQLPDCDILWNVPFQGGKFSSDSQVLTVSSLTQQDVDLILEYFPKLQTLEAEACRDYLSRRGGIWSHTRHGGGLVHARQVLHRSDVGGSRSSDD